MKKPSRKYLKDKADKLFSKHIRSKGFCELAGKDNIHCGGYLQTMHIDTRGKHAIRWNPLNAICGCAGHHVYYTHHPKEWYQLVETYFPERNAFVEEHGNDLWDKDIEKVIIELEKLVKNDIIG